MQKTVKIILAATLLFIPWGEQGGAQALENQRIARPNRGSETFVVNSPAQVEDCILRRSEVNYRDEVFWTAWNFGASQVLDAGFGIAMWNMWHGNILIRFDLRGVPCTQAESAVFRIYKPKNITQVSGEVPIAVYQVKSDNLRWREGGMESMPQSDAASWQYAADGKPWAGGMNGCGVPGVDYDSRPLGMARASKYESAWLEFDIPHELVQLWLEHPELNAGLLIKVDEPEEIMGDHVLFYASEHSSGKGPELVITGKKGTPKVAADPGKKFNPRYVMPSQGEAFQRYLAEDDFRYKTWTLDPVIGLEGDQRIYPYYWDIVVSGEYVLPYAYYPFSLSIPSIDELIATGANDALLQWQVNRLRYLHIWEYVREQRWYDCGDIIENLSPYQAALIWLGSKKDNGMIIDGVLNKIHPKGQKNLTPEQIIARMDAEWEEINSKVPMNSIQREHVKPFIREMERLRCENYNVCNTAAQEVHTLLARKESGRAMIDALGAFMNWHDIYLFYDSYFQIQRCAFLLDNTDPAAFTAFWKQQKFGEYNPDRVLKRFKRAQTYWPENRPPLEVVNKNNAW